MIADGFGQGYNGPLIVTVDITQTTDIFDDLDAIGARLADVDGVAYVGEGLPNETVDTAIIQVVPESAPDRPRDEAGRPGHPRARGRDPRRLRHAHRGHRLHGRLDRHLAAAHRRARAVRAHRGRALDHPAAHRVPVGVRADQGRARLPALGVRRDRRDRRGLPVGMARRPHARRARADPQLPADPAHGRALRPRDGLRGVPRLGHARGVRQDPGSAQRRSCTASSTPPASSRRPRSSCSSSSSPSCPRAPASSRASRSRSRSASRSTRSSCA